MITRNYLRRLVEDFVKLTRSPALLSSILIVLIALLCGGVIIFASGGNPFLAYYSLIIGAFGSLYNSGATVALAVILLLCGLSALIPFKCGIWNIGADGQLYMGAIGATLVALSFPNQTLVLPLAVLTGVVLGSAWGLITAFLK